MPKKITFLLSSIPPFLCLVFFPWILLHILFNPSCSSPIFTWNGRLHPDDPSHVQLKAMVVGDLHLGGPTTMWLDRARRDSFMKASFKRAFQILKPHALLILGDISDWGRKSTEEQWGLVMRRFKDMVKPFLGLPYHVIVGNHDIGDYYQVTPTLLRRFVNSFPGLDETASAAFTIRNISFVSVNAMALACDVCPTFSSAQKAVEQFKAALDLSGIQSSEDTQQTNLQTHSTRNAFKRPVLLTHLPLYRADESVCDLVDVPKCAPWHEVEGGCSSLFESAKISRLYTLTPYRSMLDMLSLNTSKYLLSTLQPSLVLSAHAHRFCNRLMDDATREVTVSTFTWRNRDDPSFLLIHFYKDGTHKIQQCFLPRESLVVGLYVLQGTVLMVLMIFGGIRFRRVQRRGRLHFKT
eukprot:c24245_g1_i1 orf=226-1452(+)